MDNKCNTENWWIDNKYVPIRIDESINEENRIKMWERSENIIQLTVYIELALLVGLNKFLDLFVWQFCISVCVCACCLICVCLFIINLLTSSWLLTDAVVAVSVDTNTDDDSLLSCCCCCYFCRYYLFYFLFHQLLLLFFLFSFQLSICLAVMTLVIRIHKPISIFVRLDKVSNN